MTRTDPTVDRATLVAGARRVVVKVGSSSLTTAAGGIDPARVRQLVDVLAAARGRGAEVVLVSSGAIAAGLAPLGLTRRPRSLAAQQAAASVGQGLLVHRYTEEFARHGLVTGQVLLTVDDVTRRAHYRNAYQTFAKLLELGVLPIVNENDTVATSEIRFGDNDRLAALVAHLVHADLLVLLSDVDGLYDGPPSRAGRAAAARRPRRRRPRRRPHRRRRARPASAPAAWSPRSRPPGSPPGPASRSCSPPPTRRRPRWAAPSVGTLFHATGGRRPTRLLWLAHATDAKGTAGPRRRRGARGHRAPRLAAGRRRRRASTGAFVAGDPVDLVGRRRRRGGPRAGQLRRRRAPRAAGPLLAGSSSASSGAAYEREVVHRDDLVLL